MAKSANPKKTDALEPLRPEAVPGRYESSLAESISEALSPALDGRRRVVVESLQPEIDGGRYAVKRAIGDTLQVEADIFSDGHDLITCRLLYSGPRDDAWHAVVMQPIGNDRWQGSFRVSQMGEYRYTVEGWVDRFKTWQHDMSKRLKAGQEVRVDLLIGAELVAETAKHAFGEDARALKKMAQLLRDDRNLESAKAVAVDPELEQLVATYPDSRLATRYDKELRVVVDRERAAFSSWYEMFPRSASIEPGQHGTFRDCIARLPYVEAMGFDVLYFPPVHPIGKAFRKGKNNSTVPHAGDVGSPWAIGGEEGGHTSVHPELGTLDDFDLLVNEAKKHGMEIALDLAYQVSPDHPLVRKHPEFFRARPDGTIQYAENPPKKYQDIYPIDFETRSWRELWRELKSVVDFWIDHGVRIFRVDNPHTKAFPFWEWMIADVKAHHPETIFLAEAFTRPKVMYRLAKLGFSQSYTYFTWRNTKAELTDYFTELTATEVREYFRPNVWPNTPDILHESLQKGGRPAFMFRLILAATLSSNYGIYGPAFELTENVAREAGSEEYLNSEKYELKHWPLNSPDSLRPLIARVNQIRRENPALHRNHTLRFHVTDNPMLIAYSKCSEDKTNVVLAVVNLDPVNVQSGWVTLDLPRLGLRAAQSYVVHDLLTDAHYTWQGERNFVMLRPGVTPAHIFSIIL